MTATLMLCFLASATPVWGTSECALSSTVVAPETPLNVAFRTCQDTYSYDQMLACYRDTMAGTLRPSTNCTISWMDCPSGFLTVDHVWAYPSGPCTMTEWQWGCTDPAYANETLSFTPVNYDTVDNPYMCALICVVALVIMGMVATFWCMCRRSIVHESDIMDESGDESSDESGDESGDESSDESGDNVTDYADEDAMDEIVDGVETTETPTFPVEYSDTDSE